jgi:hypothetical protein
MTTLIIFFRRHLHPGMEQLLNFHLFYLVMIQIDLRYSLLQNILYLNLGPPS